MSRDLRTPAWADGPRPLSAETLARAQAAAAALVGEMRAALAKEFAGLEQLKPDLLASGSCAAAWDAVRRRVHDIKGLGSAAGCPTLSEAAAGLWSRHLAAGHETCDFDALSREIDDLFALFRSEAGQDAAA